MLEFEVLVGEISSAIDASSTGAIALSNER